MEILLNFTNSGSPSQLEVYNGVSFNDINASDSNDTAGASAPIVADLFGSTGVNTGVSFFQTQAEAQTGFNGASGPYTGDAAWVAADPVGERYWYTSTAAARIVGFGNLDPTKAYRIEGFSSRETISGTRPTDWTIGATTQSIESLGNTTDTAIFTGITPDANNQIIIEIVEGGGGFGYANAIRLVEEVATTPAFRKSSTFDVETTLGTITTATLDAVNVFDHLTGQAGTTVSFAGAATDEITTSGEYTLTLGDGVGTENITVQVNVYGVAPSNNPFQKDGSVLASLTGVQVRVTDGANLNGTQLEYLPEATFDASGNLGNVDLSSTAAANTDPVLLHVKTAAGDSIISDETVGLI